VQHFYKQRKEAHTMNKQVITIIRNGVTYRFTDIINHGTHYSAKQVFDNGSIGKMVHRITLEEMEQATTEQTDKE
jgi:hypothetical protein